MRPIDQSIPSCNLNVKGKCGKVFCNNYIGGRKILSTVMNDENQEYNLNMKGLQINYPYDSMLYIDGLIGAVCLFENRLCLVNFNTYYQVIKFA